MVQIITMIIPNKLIKLDYDPTKDILFVEWPDFNYFSLAELHQILNNIVETIRHYDINYLMIDARTTVVSIKESDYNIIALNFAQELMKTRVKKVARLSTTDVNREKQVASLKIKSGLTVDLESFETVDEALEWFQS